MADLAWSSTQLLGASRCRRSQAKPGTGVVTNANPGLRPGDRHALFHAEGPGQVALSYAASDVLWLSWASMVIPETGSNQAKWS